MSERRVKVQRDDRIVINREFESVEEFIREYVTNLSRSGAFIRSKTPLPVGTRCHLKFSVIMEEIETIEGIGEVVRVSKSPMGMGVVFVQLNEHSQDLIAKLLTRRAASQAPIAQPPQATHQSGQHAQARTPTPAASKAAQPAPPAPSRTTDIMMTPARPQQGAGASVSQSSPRTTRAMPGFGSGSIPGVDPNAGLKGPGALKGLSAQPSGGGGGGAGSGSGDGGTGKPQTTLPPTPRGQIPNSGGNTNPRASAPKPGGRARVNTPPTITTPRATKK